MVKSFNEKWSSISCNIWEKLWLSVGCLSGIHEDQYLQQFVIICTDISFLDWSGAFTLHSPHWPEQKRKLYFPLREDHKNIFCQDTKFLCLWPISFDVNFSGQINLKTFCKFSKNNERTIMCKKYKRCGPFIWHQFGQKVS